MATPSHPLSNKMSPFLILTDKILCYMRSVLLLNSCTSWRWLTVSRNISHINCNNTLNSFVQPKILLIQVSNILGLAVSMKPTNSAFRIFSLFDPEISCSFKLHNVLTIFGSEPNLYPQLTLLRLLPFFDTLWTFFLTARGNKANPKKITTVQQYSSTKHTLNQFETSLTPKQDYHWIYVAFSQYRLKSKVTVFSIHKN